MPWMTVDGADIDSAAGVATGAMDSSQGVPATAAARMVGDHQISRRWRSRRPALDNARSLAPRDLVCRIGAHECSQVVASSTNAHSGSINESRARRETGATAVRCVPVRSRLSEKGVGVAYVEVVSAPQGTPERSRRRRRRSRGRGPAKGRHRSDARKTGGPEWRPSQRR